MARPHPRGARAGGRAPGAATCLRRQAVCRLQARRTGGPVKVLLVTRHFPPGGGGGVQRPLKFATHLPALGIETHVLAPMVSGEGAKDEELELPTQAWIHRVRYVGPRASRPSEELLAKQGVARL